MDNTSLSYLLANFVSKFRDSLDKQMKEIGIHGGQVFVLNLLWEHDGLSQAEIVKALKLSAPTIYNMCSRLSETGFIKIKKDKNDARMMRIFLTKKGLDIQNQVEQQWIKFEDKTFSKLTQAERLMLQMLILKLSE